MKNGQYWQWRKGSHKNRIARYGGKFETLDGQRKIEYEFNKEEFAKRRQGKRVSATQAETGASIGTIGIGDVGERGELLPAGGD